MCTFGECVISLVLGLHVEKEQTERISQACSEL
jgi:hypothetical protein